MESLNHCYLNAIFKYTGKRNKATHTVTLLRPGAKQNVTHSFRSVTVVTVATVFCLNGGAV